MTKSIQETWNKPRLKFSDIQNLDFGSLDISDMTPRQAMWHLVNDILKPVTCGHPDCDNPVKFGERSYRTFCSQRCSSRSPQVLNKIQESNQKKYGYDWAVQSPRIQDRIEQTNLSKYGSTNNFARADFKDLRRETMISRYGVEHCQHSEIFRQKTAETNLERYGTVNPSQCDGIKLKRKQTVFEKYGVDYAAQIPERIAKSKLTVQSRLGVDYPLQSKEIQEQIRQHRLERHRSVWPAVVPYALEILYNPDLFLEFVKDSTVDEIVQNLGVNISIVINRLYCYDCWYLLKNDLTGPRLQFLFEFNVNESLTFNQKLYII